MVKRNNDDSRIHFMLKVFSCLLVFYGMFFCRAIVLTDTVAAANSNNTAGWNNTFTDATSCKANSPTGGKGSSINDACNHCFSSSSGASRWGVFWINGENNNNIVQPVNISFVKTNIDEDDTAEDGKFNGYLHGSYINCTGNKRANSGMKAWAVHFVNIKSGISNTSTSHYYDGDDDIADKEVKFITRNFNDETKLERYKHGDGNVELDNHRWATNPEKLPLGFTIDLAKFGKFVANDKKNNNGRCTENGDSVKCWIGLFRCPTSSNKDKVENGNVVTDSNGDPIKVPDIDDQCWANNAEIEIKNIKINTFDGQAKVKKHSGGDWVNAARHTFDGTVQDVGNSAVSSFTILNNTSNNYPSDAAGGTAGVYSIEVNNNSSKHYHVNFSLKPEGVGKTEYWAYAGNTLLTNGIYETESTKAKTLQKCPNGAESCTKDPYGVNDIYVKHTTGQKFDFYLDKNDDETLQENEKLSGVINNNTMCFTLVYLDAVGSSHKNTRTICIKATYTGQNVPEGRIFVESGDGASTLVTSATQTKTDWSDWSSHSDTAISEPNTFTFHEDTKDVYAHFRFDVKATSSNPEQDQFRYRVVSCSSNNTDACYDWIENLSVSDFSSLNDGSSISGHPETQVYKDGMQHVSVKNNNRDCTATNGCIIDYRKDSTTPKKFELEKGRSYLVCYKLFVAADNASGNNPSEWNSSVACARFTSDEPPQGDLTGYTKLKFRTNRFPGCTWHLDDGSVPAPNDEDNVNVKAKSGETKTLTVECPNTTTSIDAVFTHPVSSINGQLIYNKVNVKAYHQNSTSPFYNSNLPATTPAAVNTTIKYNSNGTSTIYPGETVCEELKVGTNAKSKACMKFKQGGELTGYIDAICPDGESTRVYITEDRESVYRECNSPGEVRFIHHGSGSNVPATLHRMYHNNCIAEIDGRCPSVSASVRETVSGNIVEGVNFTMYTGGDGRYQLQEGYLICESARFGNNDENYKHGRVCLHASIDSQCPALSSYPSGWSSASKADGTSYTYSFVKNVSTGGGYTQTTRWEGNYLYKNLYNPVYAKPGDKIEFMHCYLPGAQEVRTTKYWEDITEPAPASPYDDEQCSINSSTKFDDEDYEDPIGCSSIPSFTLNSGNGDSQIGNTDFVVSSGNQEKLVEANHVEGNHTDYNFENNKYEINTISTPGTHAYLGTGIYTGSSFSENTIGYITTIGMKYDGTGYNNTTTGTAGKKDIGTATNSSTVYITIGAPGGTLTQSATAYVGRIKRKEHAQNWHFYFGYDYEVCGHYSDDEPDEDATCFPLTVSDYSNIPKSSSDTYGDQDSDTYCSDYSDDSKAECLARGTGTGDHGRVYYERDKSTSVNTFAKRVDNSEASVVIPYNYENTATVQLQEDYTIYAGEAFTLKNAKIKVGTRQNNTTAGNYATIAPNITAKLYAYASSDDDSSKAFSRTSASTIDGCSHYHKTGLPCVEIDSITKDYNEFGNMNGSYEDAFKKKEYNAFDITAGYYLCVGLGMNPSKTYDTSVDTSSVYYSQPACQKVYKKPTFAVWGGSVFSNGTIASNKAEKRTIANYYDLSTGNYTATGKDRYRIFSSWVEGVIVANGKVQNTASGAATAYTFIGNSGTAYAPIAAPGGSLDRNFCHLSPLTIANSSCSSGYSGYAQIGNNTSVKQEILRRYIDKYFNLDDSHDDSTMTGSGEYFMARNELTNSNNTIPKAFDADANVSIQYGQTRIIASKYDINITHDITYPDTYASANQLPQLIVYTRGNINISANVQHLNGVFIADGTINTCTEYDSSDEANTACSVQLRIDGSIIANKVEFNRTFGAAIGSNSIIPAEIINYDPTLFLWSSNKSSEEITETFSETYTRELSPRQ